MIRVLLVDDQELVRTGFRMILEHEADLTVVGEAGDGVEALELAEKLTPDVVLMDIRMPRLDGIEATRWLQEFPSPPRVVVLTTFDLDDLVYAALEAGASGFLLKDAPAAQLSAAIRTIAQGEALLAPAITKRLITSFLTAHPPRADAARSGERLSKLTPREREVLVMIAAGLSNDEIAAAFVVSQATVKTHISRLFQKLAVRDRAQAVIAAYESRLVEPG